MNVLGISIKAQHLFNFRVRSVGIMRVARLKCSSLQSFFFALFRNRFNGSLTGKNGRSIILARRTQMKCWYALDRTLAAGLMQLCCIAAFSGVGRICRILFARRCDSFFSLSFFFEPSKTNLAISLSVSVHVINGESG